MSTASKSRTGKEVIEALMAGTTPASKAKATRMQNAYVAQRAAEGKDPKKVLAGLRSQISRTQNTRSRKTASPKKGRAATKK